MYHSKYGRFLTIYLNLAGWTQIEYQNKHYNINEKDEET
jgi:hypothetical protein